MSPDLAFALELADLADALSLPRFRAADLRVERKPDLSPVTDADRLVERTLRHRIEVQRPGDGVLGEEEGDSGGSVRWILDPIDGTRNFTRGLPMWATLIALERDGEPVCGVVSAPALGHRWWAARGEGAFRDRVPLRVSGVARLADAAVSCAHGRDLARLEPATWHARGLGDFWQNMLVAQGSLDAAVDAHLRLWDYAALVPILEEAGGRVSAVDGGPAREGRQFVCTNGLVHDELLAALTD
ncbi:MAG TPA: inositol monophosphatase family protein [Gaiellaceae bacterium]|nr:inositol monophosphatase family protein [Gaiellaceae bacterium]